MYSRPQAPPVAGVPTVLHPLHHISVHVMQPERVRRERAHRRRAPSSGTVVRLLRRYRRTEVIRPRRPRACHVLPLRLAQQPVRLACHPRQPPHVRLRIRPAHMDDRPSPPAQPLSSGLCEHPPPRRHASHSSNVTSYTPTANGSDILTRCTGPSSASRPFSPDGEPIMKLPAGTATISRHQVPSQSRKTSPSVGPADTAAGGTSTTSPASRAHRRDRRPRKHFPVGDGAGTIRSRPAGLQRARWGNDTKPRAIAQPAAPSTLDRVRQGLRIALSIGFSSA